MDLLKKIKDILFEEEEEEILEEGELETIRFQTPASTTKKESYYEQEITPHETKNSAVLTEKKDYSEFMESQQSKSFQTIQADGHNAREQAYTPLKKTIKPNYKTQTKTVKVDPVKTEFEFTPVISPMFGSKEENKKKTVSNIPQNRTTNHKVSKRMSLSTIISPMYGADEEFDGIEEEIETKTNNVSNAEEHVVDNNEQIEDVKINVELNMTPDVVGIENILAEEKNEINETMQMESIPLNDLLENNDLNENEEDIYQISLFGKEESVSKMNHEDPYMLNEKS